MGDESTTLRSELADEIGRLARNLNSDIGNPLRAMSTTGVLINHLRLLYECLEDDLRQKSKTGETPIGFR